MVTDQNLLQHS